MQNKIEILIDQEKWSGARKAILAALKQCPEDHWLLTRLGLTHYEERNYKKALEIEEKAVKLAPNCPLVLWDFAGSLQALERHGEAIKIYRRIILKGVDKLAYGECGEGRGRARGLIADCHYRLSISYRATGQENLSLKSFEKHLDLRGPGCYSIYPLKDLLTRFKKLQNKRSQRLVKTSKPKR
jgi:tetratricopeptide (TPR) repeat protein